MNFLKISLFLLFLSFSVVSFGFNASCTLGEWIESCRSLPTNRTGERVRGISELTIEDSAFGGDQEAAWAGFGEVLNKSINSMVDELHDLEWRGDAPAVVQDNSGNMTYDDVVPFAPFVRKVDFSYDVEIIFHGDFHGDCHSLMCELEDLKAQGYLNDNFEIVKENVYFVFLGDYVDRGLHGAEVLFTILRLRLANPYNVILVRGNHEDLTSQVDYGFTQECHVKFGGSNPRGLGSAAAKIANIYELMPVALYIGRGDSYLQCCHGGMEPGFNPSDLINGDEECELLGELEREDIEYTDESGDVHQCANFTPTEPFAGAGCQSIGYMWYDFIPGDLGETVFYRKGRSLAFAKGAVESILEDQNDNTKMVRGIFRAHQHNKNFDGPFNLMQGLKDSNGVYKLWEKPEDSATRSLTDGLVWTFNVAPDSGYGVGCDFNTYAYAILNVKNDYEDWTLQVYNIDLAERMAAEIASGGGGAGDLGVGSDQDESSEGQSGGHKAVSEADILSRIEELERRVAILESRLGA